MYRVILFVRSAQNWPSPPHKMTFPWLFSLGWKRWNSSLFTGDVLPRCSRPLGIEMRRIPDHSMTSLTANYALIGQSWTGAKARLNRKGVVNAWMPNHDGRNQYLQVCFVYLHFNSFIFLCSFRHVLYKINCMNLLFFYLFLK